MAQLIAPSFGNGSDGVLTISSNTTDTPIDSSCSGTSGSTSLSATNASFAAGQLIMIHQSRGTGVGNWELNKIASYATGTITTVLALANTYTDSGSSQAQVLVVMQYSGITINSGYTLTAKAWTGDVGGILALACSGKITVTGTITASQKGYIGGNPAGGQNTTGKQGEGSSGASATSSAANGNGGGGGITPNPAYGGGTSGAADLATMTFGGAGGSAGWGETAYSPATAGTGGNGGGIIFLLSNSIVVTGAITCAGQQGYDADSTDPGTAAGGGGAGGSILLKGQSITLGTNLVTALKANGGASGGRGHPGAGGGHSASGDNGTYGGSAAGADGRIRIETCSRTGTTNPSASEVVGGFSYCGGGAYIF